MKAVYRFIEYQIIITSASVLPGWMISLVRITPLISQPSSPDSLSVMLIYFLSLTAPLPTEWYAAYRSRGALRFAKASGHANGCYPSMG
jgi:hypothetical protein